MPSYWPIAKFNRMDAMRKAFDGSRGFFSDSDVNLVIALVCVLAAALAIFFAVRFLLKTSWVRENPYLLFWELCWAHRLNISDCFLLLQLTRRQKMENPAFVFLEPDAFSHPTAGGSNSARFENLYQRLF